MDQAQLLLTFQLASFLGQAAGAAILGALFGGFHRVYGRDYTSLWGWAWLFLALHQVGSTVSLLMVRSYGSDDPLRLAVSAATLACGYGFVVWLALGTWELDRGALVSRRTLRFLLLLCLAVASLSVLAWAGVEGAGGPRLFLRYHLRMLFAGGVLLWSGWVVWRRRGRRRSEGALGPAILAGAYLLFGVEHLHYFVVGVMLLVRPVFPGWLPYFGFVDLLLVLAAGLGAILWVLQQERQRVLDASQEIEYLAGHDPVTGLPNLSTFRDRLKVAMDAARERGTRLAVLMLDLDQFKTVNDSLGHSFGDEVLRAVARRLSARASGGETVARLSGDEFIVLLPDLSMPQIGRTGARPGTEDGSAEAAVPPPDERASRAAEALLTEIHRPWRIHRQEVFLSCSVGLTLFPDDGRDGEELVRQADAAVYRAKEAGGNTFRRFAPSMSLRASERLQVELGLRRALAEDELEMHYQPVLDSLTGRVVGVEALLRWDHPDRGLVTPFELLSLSARLGLTDDLDRWALAASCRQLGRWRRAGLRDLRLAVNLSAPQFRHPHLVPFLEGVLRDHDVPARRLVLEVTETMAMQDPEASLAVMDDLRQLGVSISIDDFGTGYSSLSYLRHLPVESIKIDRSFVRDLGADPKADALVDGMIALAHRLGLQVVAEGVETEAQREFLCHRGSDGLQGYLFSRPVPAADAENLVRDPPWRRGWGGEAVGVQAAGEEVPVSPESVDQPPGSP